MSREKPESVSDVGTWVQVSLSALYEFKNGVNADRRAYGQGIPFINVLEPITFSHLQGHEISGRVDLPDAAVAAYEVRKGDLVFNRTSEIGDEVGLAAAYLGIERIVFGGFVIRARPISTLIDANFAAYALRASDVRGQIIAMGQGAVRANIGQENLRRVELKLPPLPEQLAIATALTDMDALIESMEQLLTKKRQIKQGAMQELLTGKRRLPGFVCPWEKSKLSCMGVFLKGAGVKRDEALSGDLPCIRYGEIYTTHSDHVRSFTSWISPSVAASATLIRQGDLLFAGSGETKEEIGKCVAFLDEMPAYAGGDILILRPTIVVDSMFLGYLLNVPAVVRQKASKGQGDAVVHINAKALGDIEVKLPEAQEQAAIAEVLYDMDAELATLEARLTKARALKQSMAQALLTGRIRLVEPAA
ncbi:MULTISPECIES: restriction endonuclease subunit S [Xanthomonas]|uniref:restriction endonuclease subunit S n=1 Tax=Xanthomonas TaxID=338 RepID=UPI0010AD165E|nr:restriction endonuclease subunit S [Xanthomonas euvesicatoria]MCP3034882.1 restriction endonuclease subunit S [Xanthomonas euvesicatoria pv. allii]